MRLAKKLICALCAVILAFTFVSSAVAAAKQTEQKTGLPGRIKKELQTVYFDFTDKSMNLYIRNKYTEAVNYGVMKIADGVMKNSSAQPFAFGSSGGVGDDYGLSEGYVKFKMNLKSGEIALGMRLPRLDKYKDCRGIWFTFSPDGKITVTERTGRASVAVATGTDFSSSAEIKCEEKLTGVVLYVNGERTVAVDTAAGGGITVKDVKSGKEEAFEKADPDPAGRFAVYIAGSTDGYIDDLEFTHYDTDQSVGENAPREIDYSTWTAVDDLGRTVSSNAETGDPKEEKYVGLFYFLCWVGAGVHVQDNTKIYLEQGVDGLKKYLEERGGESYWAEPYFGYYRNTDTWVYRKHAYMLDAAGVDFIFLDVSNAVTFNEGHLALFDTWLQIRKEGGHTPQIVFFCGDNPGTFDKDVQNIKRTVYSEANYEKYKELFFMWEGKPLIFGNINGVAAQTKEFLSNFTVRGNWAWCDKNGYWSWLQDYRYNKASDTYSLVDGGKGRDINGSFEELAVCLGHHPSSSKGRSYVNRKEPNTKKNDFNFTLEGVGEGKCFEFQFKAAKSLDPKVMLITGWNEWIAGCFHDASNTFFAQTDVKGYAYIDQFNPEFSRDAEPMRLRDGVGFGDNYYYQMCDYIRQFKGIGKTAEASGQTSVSLTDIKSWDNVQPEYRDSIGDAELRNTVSYDADYRYINNTGRNDIDYAKVSQDPEYLYFLVKCTADIIKADGENWMNLFINVGTDRTAGWEGYGYIVNRSRDDRTVSVSRFTEGFEAEKIGEAEYAISGEYMAVKIRKSLLGADGEIRNLLFKWADNSTVKGNVMEFMDLGDAAPNDRYAFHYAGYEGEAVPLETEEIPTEKAVSTNGPETEPGAGETEDEKSLPIIEITAVAAAVIAVAAAVIIKVKKKK